MEPQIDHIQITVRDFEQAVAFYDKLMPILGFNLTHKGSGRVEEHDFDVVEYGHQNLIIGINSPRKELRETQVHRRRPGSLHHLAFKAKTNEEVDEAYEKIKQIGAEIVEVPKYFPQHGERYYAMFFKDPDGIKYEIVHEERSYD